MTGQEKLDRYLLARLMYWRDAIIGLEDGAVADVVETLEAVKREIAGLLLDEAQGLAKITDWNRERMAALDAFCDEVLAGAKATTQGVVSEAAVTAAGASLRYYSDMLAMDGLAVSASAVSMSASQIKSWFAITPLGGKLLQDWVEDAFSAGVKQAILLALRKSAVEGRGTASQVRRLLRTALDDGFSLTRREAITLARTYTQTANVEAQMAVYRKNEDLIYAYKWTSVLDNRVCARCAALDGRIYKKDERMPPLPLHPRCRCVLLPRMRIEELGISSEDLEQVARPWVVREPGNIDEGGRRKILEAGTTRENFGGWWRTLPESRQALSVGKTRAMLLREQRVGWRDLVDKATGRLYTLEELGFYRQDGKVVSRVYLEAKAGGRHGGWFDRQFEKPDKELQKSKKSFLKQILAHEGYIDNPQSHIPDWSNKDQRFRPGMISVWERHILKNREQYNIVYDILSYRDK